SLHDAFEFVQPDLVVHSGAMSKPDDCELRQADAFDANVFGTVQLLLNAETCKSFFIYLSTDFIFDGDKGMYTEADKPAPVTYYGKTKMDGEEAGMDYQHGWAIVRTSFVYGRPLYGRGNFITLAAQKIKGKEPFQIESDQLRTPTHLADLAKGIAAIAANKATGIFNIAGKDQLSPFEMALATAGQLHISDHLLTPVTRAEFKEQAVRPLKGGLQIDKAMTELNYQPLTFEEGLRR